MECSAVGKIGLGWWIDVLQSVQLDPPCRPDSSDNALDVHLHHKTEPIPPYITDLAEESGPEMHRKPPGFGSNTVMGMSEQGQPRLQPHLPLPNTKIKSTTARFLYILTLVTYGVTSTPRSVAIFGVKNKRSATMLQPQHLYSPSRRMIWTCSQ